MTNPKDFRAQFISAVAPPDDRIDLTEAALCIAGARNPAIDLAACRRQLADLARGARDQLEGIEGAGSIADALCRYLYVDRGFRGNTEAYYDPANSLLDQVLARRRGIPITLALLYINVGRTLGWRVEGIGFPSHFLVTLTAEDAVVIDPFGGRTLAERDCARMLRNAGQSPQKLDHFLRPVKNRDILLRMLNNLKLIYLRQGELAEGLSCTEWRLILDPASVRDRLDAATLWEQMGRPGAALEHYEKCLDLEAGETGWDSIREKVRQLRESAKPPLH